MKHINERNTNDYMAFTRSYNNTNTLYNYYHILIIFIQMI